MASVEKPVTIPAVSLVQGSQAPTKVANAQSSGKNVPSPGNGSAAPAAAAKATATNRSSDLQAQVAFLNKYLNDSGRPVQFRVDPHSDSKLIQEINPANGEVIAEYPAIYFPELARSLGISSALIDEQA
ncbi:MAG TPA: flagellar protein FlaG [Steroidobacteraceae bacterium]|nr:flagellar protein FlaG [Steroidobacteraceae bacterium]